MDIVVVQDWQGVIQLGPQGRQAPEMLLPPFLAMLCKQLVAVLLDVGDAKFLCKGGYRVVRSLKLLMKAASHSLRIASHSLHRRFSPEWHC